jgi:hypothetical protein
MGSELIGEPLSRVRSRQVEWLCEPYMARGKVAILDGDPGIGKSLLAIDLAARLSRGEGLPGGAKPDRPGVTVFLTAEDDAADTVRPRAEAARADLDRVMFAPGEGEPLPRLPEDLAAVEGLVRGYAADLLVIDPVMAFLSAKAAANLDQCVRRALTPLKELAARTGCAVLLIRHLVKLLSARAIHRGSGSIGIIGAARTGLLVARHPDDPELRVLAAPKSNLVKEAPSLGFRVKTDGDGRPVVEWAGPVGLSADDLGRRPEKPERALRPQDRASDWLRGELAGGPRKAGDLLAAAAAAGIPERTLRRAKADLGVKAQQVHDPKAQQSEWYWYDPSAAWPAAAPFPRPRPWRLDPLGEL